MEPSPSDTELYAEQAHRLVDNVIESALQKLEAEYGGFLLKETTSKDPNTRIDGGSKSNTTEYKEPPYEDYEVENIKWLSIQEFSVEAAEQKINEFIKTWDYEDSWLFCVDYLGQNEHQYDTRYRFRVRWSIPTRRKPIPRATASVYFTFEVSKIKPKNFPVEVYYVFETNRLVHRPGKSRFRETWLKDIIESKVIMMQDINF